MEEKKLSVEIQRRNDYSGSVQKIDHDSSTKLDLGNRNTSKYMGDGTNDNWFELRFSNLGPDRRGYHSSFIHNKK